MRKDAIQRAIMEKNLFRKTVQWLEAKASALLFRIGMAVMKISIPIQENKIIFITFRGEYDCNAKWIAEEIRKRGLPYEIVWTIREGANKTDIPEEFITVLCGSYEFYQQMVSAKFIVDNGISTVFTGYKKRKSQILIETWHGSIGIKRFAKDTNKDKNWVKNAEKEGKMTDYCISNSTMENEIYTDTFWTNSKILQLGHARNDILCEKNSERLNKIFEKVYEEFNLKKGTRLCLYAPTFRDDGDLRPYKINYDGILEALHQRFGGEWVVLTRFHFRLLKELKNYSFPAGVLNASEYPDIQELLACIDVGITDYSSWICDYLLTRRPGFLFATDMEQYEQKNRDFFYPLSSMPYPLALNNAELIRNILSFESDGFEEKCDAFLADKGCMDDGHAAERIVDFIEEITKGEYKGDD